MSRLPKSVSRGAPMSGVLAAATLAAFGLGLGACAHHAPRGTAARGAPAAAIGVNGYLWRATLDTLAFMPLRRPIPTAAW